VARHDDIQGNPCRRHPCLRPQPGRRFGVRVGPGDRAYEPPGGRRKTLPGDPA